MKLLYTNMDSLPNKFEEMKMLTAQHKPEVAVICETIKKNCKIKPTQYLSKDMRFLLT